MASSIEMGGVKKQQVIEDCCKKPVLMGIRGEALSEYALRPAERHTSGAKEALKAQQF